MCRIVAGADTPDHRREPSGERGDEAEQTTGGATGPHRDPARLENWAEQLRVDAAAQLRRRERWLQRQAADDATLAGLLVHHAERRSTVAVTTVAGSRHVGRVRGAGSELLALDIANRRVLIEMTCIETVRHLSEDGDRYTNGQSRPRSEAVGHRSGGDHTSMADVLALVVAERPEVTLVTRSGEQITGELTTVGRDVVLVWPTDRSGLIYTPLSSLSEAVLPASTVSG